MADRDVPEVTEAHMEAAARVRDYYTDQSLHSRIALAIAYAEQRGRRQAESSDHAKAAVDELVSWLVPAAVSENQLHGLRALFRETVDITHECGTPEATREAYVNFIIEDFRLLEFCLGQKGYLDESAKAEAQPTLDQLAETIRDLPSVQREWLLEPYTRSLREALTAAEQLRKAEAQPAGTGWVSVEERLPEHHDPVLAWHPDWGAHEGWLNSRGEVSGNWAGGQMATYWREMPDDPEPRE